MNTASIILLAIIGGVFLAIQGGLNAHLGVILKNPILASLSAFLSSSVFILIYITLNLKNLPNTETIKSVPIYLWFLGGLFSAIGIGIYYFTIPKLGISTMIMLGLFGQITLSLIAGHFGWFHLPTEIITLKKIIGVIILLTGIIIINN